MNTPLLTIITVCYNAAQTIAETMQTVLEQTYPAIEYIVVDGGSTDETLSLIRSYESLFRQRNIHFSYVSEPDNGIYDAMNKGIRMAHGDWINFMNSGDGFYHKDVLSALFSHPVESDVQVVYGNIVLRMSFGMVEIRPKPIEYLRKKMAFCHQAAWVRTDCMQAMPFDTSYRYAADYDFFYRYYQKGGKFKYVNLTIAYFEAEAGASSRNRLEVNREYARIHGVDQTMSWKIWFAFKSFRVRLKDGLQTLLPQKYVNAIREKNYRRIVKHR